STWMLSVRLFLSGLLAQTLAVGDQGFGLLDLPTVREIEEQVDEQEAEDQCSDPAPAIHGPVDEQPQQHYADCDPDDDSDQPQHDRVSFRVSASCRGVSPRYRHRGIAPPG